MNDVYEFKRTFDAIKYEIEIILFIAVLSFVFLISDLTPMAMYTDWIILIIGPLFKLLSIHQLGKVEIVLFFGGIIFSGYILSCLIVEKKQTLINFFQLTKPKLILFVLLFLLANTPRIGTFDTGEPVPIPQLHCTEGSQDPQCVYPGFEGSITAVNRPSATYYGVNQVLWFPYWYSVSFIESGQFLGFNLVKDTIPIQYFLSSSHSTSLKYSLPSMILYWYFLASVIVSIYGRFKTKN